MDDRFDAVKRDHRFRPIRQNQRKIQIDKRFHGIFFKKNFRENFTVDKRGRPVRESTAKNLRKFYHLSKAERKRIHAERLKDREALRKKLEEKDTVKDTIRNGTTAYDKKSKNSLQNDGKSQRSEIDKSDSDSSYLSSDEDSDVDLARGKGNVESSSDDEDETYDFEPEEDKLPDHGWGEMDSAASRSEETSNRLALCSMDWDRVKAADIFVLLDSFAHTGGAVRSVTIYPSEFGIQRMAHEEKSGPQELREMRSDEKEDEWTKDNDEKYNTEKLRQYQLNKLKYYYAIIVCDSVETAAKIYNECDGIEFETSCSKLDLRFVPDGMEFKDHPPKEELTSTPDLSSYKPVSFVTAALNQTKVGLTWDETDHKRTALTKNKFTKDDLENMDVRDFLASGSESEQEDYLIGDGGGECNSKMDDKERAEMYRKLLLGECEAENGSKADNDDIDMEITWEPDLKLKVQEDLSGMKMKKVAKEKGKAEEKDNPETSQAELEMIMLDEGDKFTNSTDKAFQMDLNDERFSALYKSSRYAIDQSDSSFRKSEGTGRILQERQARLKESENGVLKSVPEMTTFKSKSDDDGLKRLVKSVKTKSAWLGKKAK